MTDWYRAAGPLLRRLPPEAAHRLAIRALAASVVPKARVAADPILATTPWGRKLAHPVGLAAGFDKNAEAADALLGLGFAAVEVGTITPRPQAGNPRPRVFRLPENEAMINRLGFNNDGLAAAAERLRARRQRAGLDGRAGAPAGLVGANVGPNRDAEDPIRDCAEGVRVLAPLVDYLTVNVSSPNTPGLRDLQGEDAMRRLLVAVRAARDEAGAATPIAVKIAPDLTAEQRSAIARVALELSVDAIIATNTTVARPPELTGPHRTEAGGLSGRPLFQASTEVLKDLYRLTQGRVALIGVGGIASGADAYAKIRAGASLVQLYTALIYQGRGLIGRICAELSALLSADGFTSVTQAVGADAKAPS